MLDPKKKKIYIIIICVNLLGILTVLVTQWGSIFPSAPSSDLVINNNFSADNNTGTPASSMTKKEYTVPKVFPQSTNFDTSVFQSSTFKTLKPFTPLSLQAEELGREDPFETY